MIRHVYMPSALSSILAGMRVSWGYGWRTAIAAELVVGATGANAGLGWFINSSRTFLDTADAVAGILVVILLGLLSATATLTRQVNPAPRPVTAVTLAPAFTSRG